MKRKGRRVSGRGGWTRRDTHAPSQEELLATKEIRRTRLRFALIFGATALVLFSLYGFPYAEEGSVQRWFDGYLRAYAHLAGAALRIFDHHVAVSDNVITGRFSLSIVKTCDAMEANLLFLAAIAAFPAPWWRKVIAGGVGLVLLVVVNVFRICSLYFLGVYAPSVFEVAHIEVWPIIIILATVAEFVGWTFWMSGAPVAAAEA